MINRADKFVPEPERFEFSENPIHKFEVARRDFFHLLGAGIAIFTSATHTFAGQETAPQSKGFHPEELPTDISAWLHISEDGTVTGFTGKAEIGQNIRTSLAQTIADELRVPFESVHMVTADTTLTPFDAGTFGSRSTPSMTPEFRRVASAARDLLVAEAAKKWNVAPTGLVAADGKVTDPVSHNSASYGELAQGKTLAQVLPADDPTTPAYAMEDCRERNSQGGRASFRNRGAPVHSRLATPRDVAWQSAAPAVIRRDYRFLRRQQGKSKTRRDPCA